MSDAIISQVEAQRLRSDVPAIRVGDTVDVHVRIIEGNKERVQIFNGVVIKVQGTGLTQTFTVRRIVANEGVERTFPVHSPKVARVEVKRQGDVRRSKLYYLRERVGKKRRLRDRRRGLGQALATTQADAGDEQSAAKAISPGHAAAVTTSEQPVQEEAGRKE